MGDALIDPTRVQVQGPLPDLPEPTQRFAAAKVTPGLAYLALRPHGTVQDKGCSEGSLLLCQRCSQPGIEQEPGRKRLALALVAPGVIAGWPGQAAAQPGPGSALPNPRLFTVTPPGGQVGKVIEMTFTGTD